MNRWMLLCLTAAVLCMGLSPLAFGQNGPPPGMSIAGSKPTNLPGPGKAHRGMPTLPQPLGPLPPAPHAGGGPLGGPGHPAHARPAPPRPAPMRPGPLRPTTRRDFRGYTPSLPSGVNPNKLSPLPAENIRELPYLRGYSSDKFVTPPGMEMPSRVPPGKPRQRTWGDRVEDILFPLGNPLGGGFRLPRLPGF